MLPEKLLVAGEADDAEVEARPFPASPARGRIEIVLERGLERLQQPPARGNDVLGRWAAEPERHLRIVPLRFQASERFPGGKPHPFHLHASLALERVYVHGRFLRIEAGIEVEHVPAGRSA